MNEVPNTGVETPAQETQPAPKVMQQHEINALVTGAKDRGFEKGYQQAKAELMSNPTQTPAVPAQPMMAQNVGLDDSKFRQIAQEELQKQRAIELENFRKQQADDRGNMILNELRTKSSTAKSKFDDFDKVVDPKFENFAQAPEVLLYANMTDNPGECLYDLAKHPGKLAQIMTLHDRGMGQQAFDAMKSLSDSIKVNEMSANQPKPKMPLSQPTPSNVGVGNVDEDSFTQKFRGSY